MARDFDGSDDRILFTTHADTNGLTTLSIAFRYLRDIDSNGSPNRNIAWKGGSWPNNYNWFIQEDASIFFFRAKWTGSSTGGTWNRPLPSLNTWYNSVITYDGSSTSNDPIWYEDGSVLTLSENTTPSGSRGGDNTGLAIGSGHDGSYERWDGKIAYFAIWNRILSAAEALAISKGFAPWRFPRGLVFDSRLDGNGSTEYDLARGAAGTVTGAAKYDNPRIILPRRRG